MVGLVNVPHLHLGISDAALMASSDGAYGEVELRACRKFANPRLSALVAAAHAEMVAGFPSRPAVSGFRRTGDGHSAGDGSCRTASSSADLSRGTRRSALAKN
jgi:hypothetical protein